MLWMFPLLFIIHELEEIFFLPKWLRQNHREIHTRFHRLYLRVIHPNLGMDQRRFAWAATEELVLIVGLTAVAQWGSWVWGWIGVMGAFLLHLLIHIVQSVAMWRYVPSLWTSIMILPIGVGLIFPYIKDASWMLLLLCFGGGWFLMIVNLWIIHRFILQKSGK